MLFISLRSSLRSLRSSTDGLLAGVGKLYRKLLRPGDPWGK